MKVSALQLFRKLVEEYHLIGQTGIIQFTLKDLTIKIETKDTRGNLIQEWLKEWMKKEKIEFEENTNSQTFPDIYLNVKDKTKGLLEIKTFDFNRGPGFDLANFDSYCNSLLENAHRLDSDYLILAYQMNGSEITIKDIWLKKIWELAGASSTYPIKVQEKKKVIYNIRPITWYSEKSTFKAFTSKEEFISALNETRYQYPKTHHDNAHWLKKVLKNYKDKTGSILKVA
jgi:NgoBV restriction endonuclease